MKKAGSKVIGQAGEMTEWAQHGLAGLVIFALFGLIAYLLVGFRAERKDDSEMHRTERAEWHMRIDSNQARSDKVCSELTMAIKELSEATRVHPAYRRGSTE